MIQLQLLITFLSSIRAWQTLDYVPHLIISPPVIDVEVAVIQTKLCRWEWVSVALYIKGALLRMYFTVFANAALLRFSKEESQMTSLSCYLLLLSTQTDVTAVLHLPSSLEWSLLPAGRMGKNLHFFAKRTKHWSSSLDFNKSCLTLAFTVSCKPFPIRKITSIITIRIVLWWWDQSITSYSALIMNSKHGMQ